MKNFKQFLTEDADLMLLIEMAAHSTLVNGHMPLPVAVNNVLNLFASHTSAEPVVQAQILKWIFTKGLRHAALKRYELAQALSKKLGMEIPQSAVFSDQARKEIPELQQFNIDQLWNRIGGEPDDIPILGASASDSEMDQVSLSDINAALIQNGQDPLYFGGSDGLMEYIEGGVWNQRGPFHQNPDFGKNGHDLALHPVTTDDGRTVMSGIRVDPNNPKRTFYTFGTNPQGGFVPPINPAQWRNAIVSSKRASVDLVKQLRQRLESGDPLSEKEHARIADMIDKGLISDEMGKKIGFEKHVIPNTRHTAFENPSTGEMERKIYISDSDQFMRAVDALEAGIDASLRTTRDTPGWKSKSLHATPGGSIVIGGKMTIPPLDADFERNIPQYKQQLSDMMVDWEEQSIVTQLNRVWQEFPKDNLKLRLDDLMRAGIKELVASGQWSKDDAKSAMETLRMSGQPTLDTKVGAVAQGEGDPNELAADGWVPVNLEPEEMAGGMIQPADDRKVILMKKHGSNTHMKLVRPDASQPWKVISPEGIDSAKIIDPEQEAAAGNEVKAIDKFGNLLKITRPNGVVVAKRTPQGYLPVKQSRTPEQGVIAPMLSPMKIPVNVDLQNQLTYDSDRAKQEFQHFLDNPEEYGDKELVIGVKATKSGQDVTNRQSIPASIYRGVMSGMKSHNIEMKQGDDIRDDALQQAYIALQQNVGDVSFKYGAARTEPQRAALHRIMQSALGGEYDPEEVQMAVARAHNQVANGGDLQIHADGPLISPDGSVRQDFYDGLLQFGASYRANVAKNATRSWIKKEKFNRADRGTGADVGGEDDEYDAMSQLTRDSGRKEVEDEANPDEFKELGDTEDLSDMGFDIDAETEGDAADQWLKQQENPDQWAADAAASRANQAQVSKSTVGVPSPQVGAANRARGRATAGQTVGDVPPDSIFNTGQGKARPPVVPPENSIFKREHFTGFRKWREMVGTSAVYDGTKPKDGCGFNWWGAAGHPLGISIEGEPIKKKAKKAKK